MYAASDKMGNDKSCCASAESLIDGRPVVRPAKKTLAHFESMQIPAQSLRMRIAEEVLPP